MKHFKELTEKSGTGNFLLYVVTPVRHLACNLENTLILRPPRSRLENLLITWKGS